jgi:aromatic ring-opening dioxygenase catalytic subunit (LigB family)
MPLLNDPRHEELVHSMRNRVPKILKLGTEEAPRAIVLVTAHWSEDVPTISSADQHELLYDYSGFPPESYKLKYPAPGSAAVAKEVFSVLSNVGMKPKLDPRRGIDTHQNPT